MEKQFASGLMWFRRDLRIDDNAALHLALTSCHQVHCAFVFDRDILDPLPRADRRVEFIRESVADLDAALRRASGKAGAGFVIRHGDAREEIVGLAKDLGVQSVFASRDYEPRCIERDRKVLGALADVGIAFHTAKDQVVLEGRELLTRSGTPYSVFTPYRKAWLERAGTSAQPVCDNTPHYGALAERPERLRGTVPSLDDIGFAATNLSTLQIPTGAHGGSALFLDFFDRMDDYHATRDFPAVKGPSYLGVHLRFGTVSVRKLVATALQRSVQGSAGAAVWLSELVWRDFYFQILANFPHVANACFKAGYDAIKWEKGVHADAMFDAWCTGRTGYPLVDAAMAQINQTGYMHNRLRMLAGSFLVKDLGLDWRRGEAYFAQALNDFDLSANNGGWQWVASTGCDAQPWFRIFNPVTQSEKFDPHGRFIRRYLPQLARLSDAAIHAPWTSSPIELEAAGVRLGDNYPQPIIAHDAARQRTLQRYAAVRTTVSSAQTSASASKGSAQ